MAFHHAPTLPITSSVSPTRALSTRASPVRSLPYSVSVTAHPFRRGHNWVRIARLPSWRCTSGLSGRMLSYLPSKSDMSPGSYSWEASSHCCGRRGAAAAAGSPWHLSSSQSPHPSICASMSTSILRTSPPWAWSSPDSRASGGGGGPGPAFCSDWRSPRNSSPCWRSRRSWSWHRAIAGQDSWGRPSVSIAAIVGPLSAFASTRAISVALVGSGDSSGANTLLGVLHPQGGLVLVLSRFVPIALAMVTARWALKRIGSGVLEPVPLIALVATSLSYRLIVEVNLWGYYFMAVAVLLVVLDIVQGRIRVLLLVWLALVAIAFYPTSDFGPASPLWLPLWLWQLVLVPIAIALAANPLMSRASARGARTGNPHLVRS